MQSGGRIGLLLMHEIDVLVGVDELERVEVIDILLGDVDDVASDRPDPVDVVVIPEQPDLWRDREPNLKAARCVSSRPEGRIRGSLARNLGWAGIDELVQQDDRVVGGKKEGARWRGQQLAPQVEQ